MGHVYQSYMAVGMGEALRNLLRVGETWHWALLSTATALVLVFEPAYERLE